VLSRSDGTSNDSGWFFGCVDQAHDHDRAENLSGGILYEMACAHPEILEFLALPAGAVVVIDAAGRVEEAFGATGEALRIAPGSYLDLRQRG
jgi:hypothetical protein